MWVILKIAQMKNDLETTLQDEGESKTFSQDLAGNCEKWMQRQATFREAGA